jgi:D-alanine-D-alanine ligase
MRILHITLEHLVPPDSLEGLSDKEVDLVKTDYDVVTGLRWLGHEVQALGLHDELVPLREAIREFKPRIVFNLLDLFHGSAVYAQNVVSYLEILRQPYTGSNPQGMVLAGDKALSKQILHYHRIKTPKFHVFPLGRKIKVPRDVEYPVIVKSQMEEASAGISQASVVKNDDALIERVKFIHEQVQTSAIAEQFIEGREFYVGMIGNHRIETFPVWELYVDKLPPGVHKISTFTVKWNLEYQKKYQIDIGPARDLSPEAARHIQGTARKIYRCLRLNGYARIDFRQDDKGDLYFLEANPNPDLAHDEEFSSAAEAYGLTYENLLKKIVQLGLRWKGLK